MDVILESLEKITSWYDYNDIVPYLNKIIETDEFKAFPDLKNQYYVEALSLYALHHWNDLPIHCQTLVLARYPFFINMVAYGKTIEEYNDYKQKLLQMTAKMNLPVNPVLKTECKEFENLLPNRAYFAFMSDYESYTAMTLDECKTIANYNKCGLVKFNLTYNLKDDLLSSMIIYNRLKRGNRLVDSSSIDKLRLIKKTDPKVATKEYEVIISPKNVQGGSNEHLQDSTKTFPKVSGDGDTLICLDYGDVGYFTICLYRVPMKFIEENRCLYRCSNDFILKNIKIDFIHTFNRKGLSNSLGMQNEIKNITVLINDKWPDNDDKDKFIENIQDMKRTDFPFYLYLTWIKNDPTIHTRFQALTYALAWLSDESL